MNLAQYKKVERELNLLSSNAGYMNKKRYPSFYLERTKHLFALLDHPELGFHYVHIGGTAGKGSVTIMTHAMLHAAGERVGSFLSPHVTTLAERTLIQGTPVSAADVVWAWKQVRPVIARIKKERGTRWVPSYFEAHFAMSMLLFKKYSVSWVVLEVGCGGEFDATNCIPSPRVCVITNIGLDHMQLLGRTRKTIAKTKSGIIKPGCHVVTGEADATIRKIIFQKATDEGCTAAYVPKPKKWTIPLGMHGDHQFHNAAIAKHIGSVLHIPKKAVRAGLLRAKLPARLEVLATHPMILLDGAHNPSKITALVRALTHYRARRTIAIMGIGHAKQHRQMLRMLLPHVDEVFFTQSQQEMPVPESPARLRSVARKLFPSFPVSLAPTISHAVANARKKLTADDLLLITGSLYLAGEARELWIPERLILQQRTLFP